MFSKNFLYTVFIHVLMSALECYQVLLRIETSFVVVFCLMKYHQETAEMTWKTMSQTDNFILNIEVKNIACNFVYGHRMPENSNVYILDWK